MKSAVSKVVLKADWKVLSRVVMMVVLRAESSAALKVGKTVWCSAVNSVVLKAVHWAAR